MTSTRGEPWKVHSAGATSPDCGSAYSQTDTVRVRPEDVQPAARRPMTDPPAKRALGRRTALASGSSGSVHASYAVVVTVPPPGG